MSLRIAETGARSGDIIVGVSTSKQCKGTIMQIRGSYPPLLPWVDNLTSEQIRDQFNNYSFFRSMSPSERSAWLDENGTSHPDLYMEDVPGLEVKFTQIAGEFMLKALTSDQINRLLAGNPSDPEGYWPIRTVYLMFPRKPNSRAKKHTLIFRPNNWCVQEDADNVNTSHHGMAIHLESGALLHGTFDTPYIIPTGKYESIACVVSIPAEAPLTYDRIAHLCVELGLNFDQMQDIKGVIEWFPPSLHKSLLQKILRTRCTHVEHEGHIYPAKEVLATSCALLMVHPGAFVPNIQRFVSGLESALKRLAVAICEDAWLENGSIITSLLTGAWLAQNYTAWVPSDDLIRIWIAYGCSALDNPYMYEYNWHTVPVNFTIPEWTPWYMNYYLLSVIRSFESDIKMLASIGQNEGCPRADRDIDIERIMPLIHCVDQHSFTDIAHYLPYEVIREFGSYPALFNRIWNEVVGINSRTRQFDFIEGDTLFFREMRRAQKLLWKSRCERPTSLSCLDEFTQIEYVLNDGWLASFVGSVEIRVGSTIAIVMMNPDDIYTYTAVKRPSRDKSGAPDLTEEERMRALHTFEDMLHQGVPLKNVPSTLSQLHSGRAQLIEDEYYILLNGTRIPWVERAQLRFDIPLHEEFLGTDYHEASIRYYGIGIRHRANETLNTYLEATPRNVLQRALIYIGYNTDIDLRHIGRDGTGTDYAVTIEDTGVSELLALIATLYPVALQKMKTKYRVKNGPVMWTLQARIQAAVHPETRLISNEWPVPMIEQRDLWEHQTDSIQNLIATRHHKKARLIWISPGLGKTCIIANYIAHLIRSGQMNSYCLYTLPPSAMATVEKEFNLLGIPFSHIDMRTASKGIKSLFPGRVTVVYHDHLRLLDLEQIKHQAPNMLFIVDEFHKTLNPTKRTSTALEISYLCDDCIAMTGTLIKDTNVDPIIVWLSMGVNFEVTTQNYWVAMSSIISRKVQTRVIVDRDVVEAPMNASEREVYYDLVPSKLGGRAHTIDFKRAVEMSYLPITREMVRLILSYVHTGTGVFVVARNIAHQHTLAAALQADGIHNIFLMGKDRVIDLVPTSPPPVPDVVITTPTYAEGYNMTRFHIMITGVYFSNQSTRDQLCARINRISQTSPRIRIITVHAGIISYVHTHYENARHLSETLKGFAREIGINYQEMMGL